MSIQSLYKEPINIKKINKRLNRFSDYSIGRVLLNEDFLVQLEDLLVEDVSLLSSYDRTNINYGKDLLSIDFLSLFNELIYRVEDFLEVECESFFPCYFNARKKTFGKIKSQFSFLLNSVKKGDYQLKKNYLWLEQNQSYYAMNLESLHFSDLLDETRGALAFIHEFTHALQCDKHLFFKQDSYGAFAEGHARGVERKLASELTFTSDNPSYLVSQLEMDIHEIREVYVWLTKAFDVVPLDEIMACKTPYDFISNYNKIPCSYSMGNAWFRLLENAEGDNIYSPLLKQPVGLFNDLDSAFLYPRN